MGIKTKIIDADAFLENISLYALAEKDQFSTIADKLRFRLGKFWTTNKNTLEIANKNDSKLLFNAKIESDVITLFASKDLFSVKKLENGIFVNQFSPDDWKNFLINPDQFTYSYPSVFDLTPNILETFYDHYFQIDKLVKIEENLEKGTGDNKFFKSYFNYNFYSPKYETATSARKIKELILPSIYNLLEVLNPSSPVINKNSEILLQISLAGSIPSSDYLGIIQNQNDPKKKNLYHEAFGEALDKPELKLAINTENSSARIYELSENAIKSVKGISQYGIPFPYYIKLDFMSEKRGEAFKNLSDNGLMPSLKIDFEEQNLINYNFVMSENNSTIEPTSVKLFDLREWLKKIANYSNGSATNSIRDEERIRNYSNLINFINTKYYKNIKSSIRSLEDIYNGVPAKSEILFYKIQKFEFSTKGEPIQEFFVENLDGKLIELIDTQIKYNKQYAYKIIACTLIIGNEYRFVNYYKNLSTDTQLDKDTKQGIFRVKYINNPSLKIVEIPIFEEVGQVIEQPGTAPEASIANIDKARSTLKLSIRQTRHQKLDIPKIIEEKDYEYFKKIMVQQNSIDMIKYSQNSNIASVEIYKTNIKPKDYVDFSGKLLTVMPVTGDTIQLLDNIYPETDYYYCFRYLTDHGEPSDISHVYHAILKDNGNEKYLETDILSLEPQIFTEDNRKFKKYLLIKPTIKQTLIGSNLDTLQDLVSKNNSKAIQLGISEEAVWGKKFKLRIKSIKTGKIIDFNFSFNRK